MLSIPTITITLSADPTDIAKPKLITAESPDHGSKDIREWLKGGRYSMPIHHQRIILRTPPLWQQWSWLARLEPMPLPWGADEPDQSHHFGSHAPIRMGS